MTAHHVKLDCWTRDDFRFWMYHIVITRQWEYFLEKTDHPPVRTLSAPHDEMEIVNEQSLVEIQGTQYTGERQTRLYIYNRAAWHEEQTRQLFIFLTNNPWTITCI